MQCDAINLVSSKNYTKANSGSSDDDDTTTKKRRKIRKYPKCFHMMAKKKMERLSFVLQKLPWQKEFQHFVPLSKKKSEKEAPHDSICFLCSFDSLISLFSFFLYVGTICILFFLPETRCLLLHKKECVLRKRNVFFRSAVRLNRPDKYKSQRQTTLRLFTNAEREKGNCNGRNGNFAKLKFDKMIR